MKKDYSKCAMGRVWQVDTAEGYKCAVCQQSVTQREVDANRSDCCQAGIYNENEEYGELADIRPERPR